MDKKNIRIIGNKIKKNNRYLHPITLELGNWTSKKNTYPTKPIYNKDKKMYDFYKDSDELNINYSQKILTSFMEKPYMPFTNEMILNSYDIQENIYSLEKFYDKNLFKNKQEFIFIFNSWFRLNINEINNKNQLNIICKFCKKVIKDIYLKELNVNEISKKLLKWQSKKKESEFYYKISEYLIK